MRDTALTKGSEIEKKWARTAKDIQNASNLVAVVGEFHQWLKECESFGVERTQHPITLALLSKIQSLCLPGQYYPFSMLDQIINGEVVEYPCVGD